MHGEKRPGRQDAHRLKESWILPLISSLPIITITGMTFPTRETRSWQVRHGSELGVLRRHEVANDEVVSDLAWLHRYLEELHAHSFPAPHPSLPSTVRA